MTSASSLCIPTRNSKRTQQRHAYNYDYPKEYSHNTYLQQSKHKYMDDYIHTYNANDSETNNLFPMVEKYCVTIEFEEQASNIWICCYVYFETNTSTIFTTGSLIPPIDGPSQFIEDNNSWNVS